MIGVVLEGRLGNQLFQYAFAYNTAKKLDEKFYLDESINANLLHLYFNIKVNIFIKIVNQVFSIKGYKLFFNHYLKKISYHFFSKIVTHKTLYFDNKTLPKVNINKLSNKVLYKGFFQSEDYFVESANDLKSLFKIKDCYLHNFRTIWNTIPYQLYTIVTVHIRRGDYINFENSLLEDTYFNNALETLGKGKYFYIFVSDDIEYVKQKYGHYENKYFSHHSEIIDLQFLIHANICVLSNSSFSWWGVYLNQNNPKVIAPKYWLGDEQKGTLPKNIIKQNWISL